MVDTIIKFLRKLGINRAISYGICARVWAIISGIITIILIAGKLTKEQQGFYFTISSLLALQVFFELGLMTVIAQFASHEFVKLNWQAQGRVDGDPVALARFTDLLSKAAKWFGVTSILLVIALIPAGLVFFSIGEYASQSFGWRFPWVLSVIGTALNLLVTPFLAVIMGSGDVVTVNHRQLVAGIVGSTVSWVIIAAGGGLYAVCATSFGNSLVSWSYLLKHKPYLLKAVWGRIVANREAPGSEYTIGWWSEVWPMQWKIAISWISSYFIYQLFTPVLFRYHGPVVAGQMGMTVSACSVLGICMTWVNVRGPEFGKLIAEREWKSLDTLFTKVFKQSVTVAVAGVCCGTAAIWLIHGFSRFGQRFLPVPQTTLLLASVAAQVAINGYATYLRAHKVEPLLSMTVIAAILQGAATLLLGKYYSSLGVTIGYFAISSVYVLPATYLIWRRCRTAWHAT